MRVLLKKSVSNNERYYILSILPNLFGEYIVERIFGNTQYLSPTGILKNIFKDKKEAYIYLEKILSNKISKGYKIFSSNIYNPSKKKLSIECY